MTGTSLVAQWLGIRLPMQGAQVLFLVREDPTCHGATKTCVPQLLSLRSRAHMPQLLKPACLEPTLRNRSHHNEKPARHNWRKPVRSNEDPTQPKINKQIYKEQ